MDAQQWLEKGNYQTINDHKIFLVDSLGFDQSSNLHTKPNLCILHGFPTSSFDYWKVIDSLSEQYRVIIHDHLGFGFSDKPMNYSYSLIDQTDIALSLWQKLGINKTTILAHDYGTSLLTEILARDNQNYCPMTIEQIILCNGSMHIEMANLRLIQRLLRNKLLGKYIAKLSSKRTLKKNMGAIYVDQTQISEQEIESIWYMMNYNQGKKVLPIVSRYTFERKVLWHRWIGALQQTELPIEIIWSDQDPIAVSEMANVIHRETKNSRLYWLIDIGHFPMLEKPDLWSQKVLESVGL